jgi:hypothetical protein
MNGAPQTGSKRIRRRIDVHEPRAVRAGSEGLREHTSHGESASLLIRTCGTAPTVRGRLEDALPNIPRRR